MKNFCTTCIALMTVCLQLQGQWNPGNEKLWQIGHLDSIYSTTLNETRHFWVHLPNNYELSERQKYPVVFILDGSVHLNGYVNYESYKRGAIPEMIVVAISNRLNRTRDLTPTNIDDQNGTPPWVSGSGGGTHFTSFIKSELIPYINENYPTTNYRTLIGHSFGGLFAINLLINHPDLFRNYIAIDPSLWWDNELMLEQLTHLENNPLSINKVFITIANNTAKMSTEMTMNDIKHDTTSFTESMRATIKCIEKLESISQSNIQWKYYANENHQSVPLLSIIDGMNYLYEWYAFNGDDLDLIRNPNSDPIKTIEAIKEHYNALSENFGYPVLLEEEMINDGGYMFMDDFPDKAYQFFKLNIENYPFSARTYAAMADFYVSQENEEKAIYYLKQAFALSKNNEYKSRITELEKAKRE